MKRYPNLKDYVIKEAVGFSAGIVIAMVIYYLIFKV